MVEQLSGLRVTWDEMRQIIHNPHTGRPIAKTSFARIFARELAEGRIRLKNLIGRRFYEALAAGEAWAVRAGLRNQYNWIFEGQQTAPLLEEEERAAMPKTINVQFCLPNGKSQSLPAIDVTPTPPTAKPDYTRPALPAPPERRRHPMGWME
jgi:hypothetical protein